MNVLVLHNHFDAGDQSYFFMEQGDRWVGLFNHDTTLREFLEDRIDESSIEESDSNYDVPDGGLDALRLAAETEDYCSFFGMLERWEIYNGITNFGDWEISYEKVAAVHLSPQELGGTLAALRMYQDAMVSGSVEDYSDIATNGGTFEPLDYEGVESLCDKLN